jgi:hypothetical protein
MTGSQYRKPPQPVSNRVRCPVCHEAVYSRAGIHPQCAVRQSDPPKPKNKPPAAPGDAQPDVPAAEPAAAAAVVNPVTVDRPPKTVRRPA